MGGASTPRGQSTLSAVALAKALARLHGEAAEPGVTVDGILRRLCVLALEELAVDGAGVMRVDGADLRFVHAVPPPVEGLESLQESLHRGPCCESVAARAPVVVPDLATRDDWPELRAGSEEAGIGSALSIPLQTPRGISGVLDLYRRGRSRWTAGDLVTARALADVAAFHLAQIGERARIEREHDHLLHRATHDELTGLPGRALLMDRLDQALRSSRRRRAALAVLFIDVDRFKQLNDMHGHAHGDQVLLEVVTRLQQALRASDTLARLSGDEFVALCGDLAGPPAQVRRWLHVLGRRIQRGLRRPAGPGELDIRVTVSIGVSVTTRPHRADDLIRAADRAMYQAKLRGGGQLVIAGSDMTNVVPGPGFPGTVQPR